MLKLDNITKNYYVGGQKIEALKGVSLEFGESEFVAILGPSGCGKTTLLNIIGGLDRYTSGDLIIKGVSTKKYKDRDWDTYRNHSIGFVFQSYNLIPHQTVFKNVELALTLAGVSSKERKKLVKDALERVGLGDQLYKKPNQMSGGQMQRVAIARALVNNPEILLADEPTGALDSVTSVAIMEILREISKDKLIIMVTHNPDLARDYASRIVRLKDGLVVNDNEKPEPQQNAQNPNLVTIETALPEIIPEMAGEAADPEAVKDISADKAEDAADSLDLNFYSGSEGCLAAMDYLKDAVKGYKNISEHAFEAADEEAQPKIKAAAEEKPESKSETDEQPEEKPEELLKEKPGELPEGTSLKVLDDGSYEAEAQKAGQPQQNTSETYAKGKPETKEKTEAKGKDGTKEKTDTKEKTGAKEKRIAENIKSPKTRKKKASMSFFTALSLSFNNLLTKKGRTFMTAFAGSIGIIGIALILALSTGVKNYIDDVQRDTLSSYPITIQSETMDLTAIIESAQGKTEEKHAEHEEGTVYANSTAYDLFNAVFTQETTKNNLTEFKKWLDNEMSLEKGEGTGISEYATSVHYTYDISLNTYVEDGTGSYRSTAVTDVFTTGAASQTTMLSSSFTSSSLTMSLWEEILPGAGGKGISDLIYTQYDLLAGKWPEEANEVLLIIDDNSEIQDLAFYTLGKMSKDDLLSIMTAAMTGKEIENTERHMTYEEILGTTLKLVLSADMYADSDGDGVYEYIADDNTMMQLVCKNGLDLKICGIIKKNPDATAGALTGPFCYTSALTEYIIEKTKETAVAKAYLADENDNFDVLTGLPYEVELKDMTAQEKAQAFLEYAAALDDGDKAELYRKIVSTPDEEYIKQAVAQAGSFETREEMEQFIAAAYGIDVSFMKEYLNAYTDDELKKMLEESTETVIRENFAEEAETTINAVITTPTEDELDLIKFYVLQNVTDKTSKMGFIANYWQELGAMSLTDGMTYLSSLDGEAFARLFEEVLDSYARLAYSQSAGDDTESANKKLAAALDLLLADAAEDKAAEYYDSFMPSSVSDETRTEVATKLGVLDLDSPSAISIYPATFEDKDLIADIISDYNESAAEEDQISYTDYVALLMSGITTIINAISYVLIAFVSVSLVVSSIMIGIITYISVLERTKEIGILRSIGASKKDVSRVFTAETLIIGFISGLIGILTSLLLCIPINLIVHALTDINNINASIPWQACVILVIISTGLTMIAGLFPSAAASRKDPVEALRTE